MQSNNNNANNNDSYFVNYYSNNPNNKIAPNHSLGYFSTTSTNTNKNTSNNNNIYINSNSSSNYVNTEKYSNNNFYSARDLIKKNYNNSVNKIIKDSKQSNISSQISGKINILQHSSNINSIQNYLKYLNIGQKNKNYNKKNSPLISKNKTHKLSENNINYIHNNTESNIYNTTYNFETKNNLTQKTFSKLKENNNNNIKIIKNNRTNSGVNEINGVKIETPDELHFFYVKLIQDGKGINFDRQFKK